MKLRIATFGTPLLTFMVACGGVSSSGGDSGGTTSAGNTGIAGAAAGAGGSAGQTAGGSAGQTAGGSAGQTAGGAPGCGTCNSGRICCGSRCVNEANDPQNCGACGKACDGGTYCSDGSCVVPPCETSCADATACCGTECCGAGSLCCDPQGPLDRGPQCMSPNEFGTCPQGCAPLCVCASPDTPIATPHGDVAIATLHVGDLVYSVDGDGVKVVPIVRVKKTAVTHHHVIRVLLATGARLEISAGHPTADGRNFGELRSGGRLDGTLIASVEKVPYDAAFTFDILPGSSTGTYFAGGALIGSTIDASAPEPATGRCVGAP